MAGIPRYLHHVWLGRAPMHPLMARWREQWAALHPGWEACLWVEGGDVGTLGTSALGGLTLVSRHRDLLKRCCHLSQRSNVWRFELLEELGGVYLDTDVQPLRNIEPLVEGAEAFAGRAWVVHSDETKLGSAVAGCVPGHPWARDLVRSLAGKDPAVSRSMGSEFFSEVTARHPEVLLLPPEVFYSQRFEDARRYPGKPPPGAYAVHRWSSLWFPGGFAPV